MNRREFIEATLGFTLTASSNITVDRRLLELSDHTFGGDGISSLSIPFDYFHLILGLLGNKQHHFVTEMNVSATQAKILADVITNRADSFEWGLTLALVGDPDGTHLRRLIQFLKRGEFTIVLTNIPV